MARRIKPKANNKKSNKNKRRQKTGGNRATLPPTVSCPETGKESPDQDGDSSTENVMYGPENLGAYMREQVAQLIVRDGGSMKDAQRILDYLNYSDHIVADLKEVKR